MVKNFSKIIFCLLVSVFSFNLAHAQFEVPESDIGDIESVNQLNNDFLQLDQRDVVTRSNPVAAGLKALLVIFNSITSLIIVIAILLFFWGLLKYVTASGSQDTKAAASTITMGLITIFVSISVWGLVNLLADTFNLSDDLYRLPGLVDFTGSNGTRFGFETFNDDIDLDYLLRKVDQLPDGESSVSNRVDTRTIGVIFSDDPFEIVKQILSSASRLLIYLAVLIFLISMLKYVKGGEQKVINEAKNTIAWGLVILFVMVSVWGLVGIISNTFDFVSDQTPQKRNIDPKTLIR